MSTYCINQKSLSHSLLKFLSSVVEEYLSYKAKCLWISFPYTMEKNMLNIQALFTWFKEKTPRRQSLSEATKGFGLHCE